MPSLLALLASVTYLQGMCTRTTALAGLLGKDSPLCSKLRWNFAADIQAQRFGYAYIFSHQF